MNKLLILTIQIQNNQENTSKNRFSRVSVCRFFTVFFLENSTSADSSYSESYRPGQPVPRY